ncbi:MAG: hypothetical protein JNL04_11925 [Rhodospirillaceae bacterium]|nr:hypothetical protein [Rhodospirillaceae bacterium]
MPGDLSAPKVLGWGIDLQAARAAATRNTNRDPSTLIVHPCTARLRQAVVEREDHDVRTDIFEDVAYAEREAAPDTVVDT